MDKSFFVDHKGFPTDTVFLGWQTDAVPDYSSEMIIPKGCVEIIFNFSRDKITYCPGGNTESVLPRCFISGINTASFILKHSSHHAFFGLRLQPQVIRHLLYVPSGEFKDKTIDLTLIDSVFNQLWHHLYRIGFDQRIALMKKWIHRAYSAPRDLDKAIGGFLGEPIRDLTVAQLSEQFCSSQRNLTRKFKELLGMCTEEALLYKKYLQSLELVHHTNQPLTGIAYLSGFYDQSHFTREFRRYTGLTPKEYRKRKGPLCGHIYRQSVSILE